MKTFDPSLGRLLSSKYTLVMSLALVLLLAGLYVYVSGLSHDIRLKEHESKKVELLAESIEQKINVLLSDLIVLKGSGEIYDFFELPTTDRREKLEKRFDSFAQATRRYHQIRLLDRNGIESVRLNVNDGVSELVSSELLQDKSKRYYFEDTLSLNPDDIYVSAFDLNIENNRIEEPWKPVIRVATKIYNEQGEFKGVLILNFDGRELIETIHGRFELYKGINMLVNEQGYWLHHPDKSKTWGFMFEHNESFKQHYGRNWHLISEQKAGQLIHEDRLLTFKAIRFPPQGHHLSHLASQHNKTWYIISDVALDEARFANERLETWQ